MKCVPQVLATCFGSSPVAICAGTEIWHCLLTLPLHAPLAGVTSKSCVDVTVTSRYEAEGLMKNT